MNFQNKTKAEKNTRLDRIGAVTSLGLLLAVAATIGISASADSTKNSTESNISQIEIQQESSDTGNIPSDFKSLGTSLGNVPTK